MSFHYFLARHLPLMHSIVLIILVTLNFSNYLIINLPIKLLLYLLYLVFSVSSILSLLKGDAPKYCCVLIFIIPILLILLSGSIVLFMPFFLLFAILFVKKYGGLRILFALYLACFTLLFLVVVFLKLHPINTTHITNLSTSPDGKYNIKLWSSGSALGWSKMFCVERNFNNIFLHQKYIKLNTFSVPYFNEKGSVITWTSNNTFVVEGKSINVEDLF